MWATTKPKRMRPVTAITAFLPIEEPKSWRTPFIASPSRRVRREPRRDAGGILSAASDCRKPPGCSRRASPLLAAPRQDHRVAALGFYGAVVEAPGRWLRRAG